VIKLYPLLENFGDEDDDWREGRRLRFQLIFSHK
jgi:hypothetical protein